MNDDWFGHRDPLTGAPLGDKDSWIEWDYRLANVDQIISDWTDQNGLHSWEVNDPKRRVQVDAVRKIDQFEAAKQRRTSGKRYKAQPGEYFVPKVWKTTEEWPGFLEYVESLSEGE